MIPNIFRANNPRQKRMPMTSVHPGWGPENVRSQLRPCRESTKCSILLPDKPRSAAPQAISDLLLPARQTDRHHVRLAVCLCVFSGFPVRDPDECLGQLTWLTARYVSLKLCCLCLYVCVCVARIETWNGADNDNGFSGSGLGSSNAIRLPRARGDCRGRCWAAASGSDRQSLTHSHTYITHTYTHKGFAFN